MFVRPGHRRRRRETLQRATPFARGDAFLGLHVVGASFRRRSAAHRDTQYDELDPSLIPRDANAILDAHFARWLHALVVYVDEPARDGSRRLRAALEKACTPEPLIDAQRLAWKRWRLYS